MSAFFGRRRWKYTDRRVEREGRIDGRLGIPPWDAESLPPFPKEICEAGGSSVRGQLSDWQEADGPLQAKWAQDFLSMVRAGEEIAGPAASLTASEHRYTSIRKAKAPATDRRRAVYLAACVVAGIGDIAFNQVAFRVSHESELLTLVVTTVLGLGLVLGAHFMGEMARKRQYAAIVTILMIVIAAIASVGYFRSAHMAAAQAGHTYESNTGGIFNAR